MRKKRREEKEEKKKTRGEEREDREHEERENRKNEDKGKRKREGEEMLMRKKRRVKKREGKTEDDSEKGHEVELEEKRSWLKKRFIIGMSCNENHQRKPRKSFETLLVLSTTSKSSVPLVCLGNLNTSKTPRLHTTKSLTPFHLIKAPLMAKSNEQ